MLTAVVSWQRGWPENPERERPLKFAKAQSASLGTVVLA